MPTLASVIREEFAYRFEQDRCDEDDEDEPTLGEALHEIIDGKPLRERYGHKYAYALEMLCWHFGASSEQAAYIFRLADRMQ